MTFDTGAGREERGGSPSRSRRSILLGGAAALAVLFVGGAVVQLPRIESDLQSRVDERLAVGGFAATSSFSGQDATLRCSAPLADPAAAVAVAESVWGVRTATLDATCTGDGVTTTANDATTAAPTASTTNTTAPTVVETTTVTTAAPTTVAVTTTTAAPVVVFGAQFADGLIVLSGKVGSDLERFVLVQRAQGAVAPANVINLVVVDPTVPTVPADSFGSFLNLMAAMPPNLVTGSLEWNGGSLVASGSYIDDTGRAAFGAAAAAAGVAPTLTVRATATADQAAALEIELNALVAAEPILFDKGSTTISLSSLATVQKVAGIAKRYAGVSIDVQGHTDSEGDPGRNLTLSQQRAAAVRDALVVLGVPAAQLTSQGFGLTQPILDAAGNEVPELSRRVVFGVTLA
ncbi:MAG: OmpA family protein [Actinomycetota bacterium]|nr:OmpA family protein [Actinomycetota bacterium]